MVLYADLTYDSRVRREAVSLVAAGFDVTLVCLSGPSDARDLPAGVNVVYHAPPRKGVIPGTPVATRPLGRIRRRLAQLGWLLSYITTLRSWGRGVPRLAHDADVWHLHDLTALAGVLPALPPGARVVYDAHELFLESGLAATLPVPVRRLLHAYERRLVRRVTAIVTVNDELASVLRRRYPTSRMVVVHNCPGSWVPPEPRPTLIRDAAKIPAGAPIVLYHGGVGASRGIEQLMDAISEPGLERVHLVVMGRGPMRETYLERSRRAPWLGKVHVLDAVPPDELLLWVASADIGALPIQRSTLNHYLSTPNKLFECMAAGVPVVASDFPAIRQIVNSDPDNPLGILCDPASVEQLAQAIRSLSDLGPVDMAALRACCLEAAHGKWNWEREVAGLAELHRDLAFSADRVDAGPPERQRK